MNLKITFVINIQWLLIYMSEKITMCKNNIILYEISCVQYK